MPNTNLPSNSENHASEQHNQTQAKQELMSILLEGKLSGEKERLTFFGRSKDNST